VPAPSRSSFTEIRPYVFVQPWAPLDPHPSVDPSSS
jgi:hypothetical protein